MANRTGVFDESMAGASLPLAIRISRFTHRHARFIFPAPALLVVALIIVYPVFYTGWMSLQEWFASSLTPPKFIAFANYNQILTGDPRFRDAFFRTLYFTFIAVSVETVLAWRWPSCSTGNFGAEGWSGRCPSSP